MFRATLPELMTNETGIPTSEDFVKALLNMMPFFMLCTVLAMMVVFRTRKGVRSVVSTSQLHEALSSKPEDAGFEKPDNYV